MALETYNKKNFSHKKKSVKIKSLIFIFFLFVVASILLSVYPQSFKISGFSISQQNINVSTLINASLSIPELTMKNNFEELQVIIENGSSVIIGGKTFSFKESGKEIILKDFQGKVSFDEDKIYVLTGKASEVIMDGTPITANNRKIDITLNSEASYKKIEIPQEIYIKSLNYISKGEIYLNEDLIKPNYEQLFLTDFFGSLKAENKSLYLNGKIGSVEIIGENRKIKVSN